MKSIEELSNNLNTVLNKITLLEQKTSNLEIGINTITSKIKDIEQQLETCNKTIIKEINDEQ